MSAPKPSDGGRDNGHVHDTELELNLDDEELAQLLDELEAEDHHAVGVLIEALNEQRGFPAPQAELDAAAQALREGLNSGHHPFDWIRGGADLEDELLADDAELLLACAAGTISPREETGLDPEDEATIGALEHADWLGSIVFAARSGPGADVSAHALVTGIHACPEIAVEGDTDPDEDTAIEWAFVLLSRPWKCLGLTDEDERLTTLGAWALPRALAHAWGGEFDPEPAD